ncbi:hypothetical protein ACFW9N_27825 [Streptomyces sp. NPDC059496]|uniref:hypothetical protein n=1 Tax=Streptomyces sp. NPDC059496 TaxID=3346851 RepID=UPI0036939265
MALICGHDAPAYGLPVCEHIRSATAAPIDHYLHYTGRGLEQQRICGTCREPASGPSPDSAPRTTTTPGAS